MIVITTKEKVGEIRGNSIWRVTGTEMHSYKRNTMHLTEKQVFIFRVLGVQFPLLLWHVHLLWIKLHRGYIEELSKH